MTIDIEEVGDIWTRAVSHQVEQGVSEHARLCRQVTAALCAT